MNIINDYTRVSTQLIENLTLDANNDAELTIVRAGNSTDTQKNPLSVKLYNTYQPIAPTNWTFNADGAWTTYCDLATTLKRPKKRFFKTRITNMLSKWFKSIFSRRILLNSESFKSLISRIYSLE